MAAELHRERDMSHCDQDARQRPPAASGISLVLVLEYGQTVLVGREGDLRRVTTLLDEARRGRSESLLVVGDPGLGKSALLAEARSLATDMQVLVATGVEAERELPFASLHELFRPVLDLLPRLPGPQAHALAAALALEQGEPDALAVGAGALSLLVEASEQSPLLVVLDDAHWLDRASAEALAFAARRLVGEHLAFLVALRPGLSTPFEAFERLELEPLAPDEARRLLERRPEHLSAADERRLLDAAAGNPLVLLELPLELARDLPETATPHERLARAFSQRIEELPEVGRRGVLLAAAEPDPNAVRRAAEGLALDDPLGSAEEDGLVRIEEGEIRFRHPVVRSLVYSKATAAERRSAHRALAEALSDDADRDRRAWHLAAAADGVDEQVAAILEETAERAAARGGHAAGARALERAARLSPQRSDAARRLYEASRAAFWAGDATHARELAEEALPLADDPLLHADLIQQLGGIGDWQGQSLPETVFLKELERIEGLDGERAARMLYVVITLRLKAFDAEGAAALAPRLEAAAEDAGPWWRPRTLSGAAAAYLHAGERERALALFGELATSHAMPAGFAFDYLALEWYDVVRESLDETLREGRANGNRLRIVWNQSCAAHLELRQGRLNAAAAAAAEAIELGGSIGTPALVGLASAALAGVQAWRGQSAGCAESAEAALSAGNGLGDRFQEVVARQALALLALGEGRTEDAIAELEPLARVWAASTVVEPGAVTFVPELIEAYAVSGARAEAGEWLARFARIANAADRRWALAACARCEGLLAPADSFDEPFLRALELLDASPLPLELARTRLSYGEQLRRQGRRRDARMQLRPAHDLFASAGATRWQERAAAELRATGERATNAVRPTPELTPQELNISLLVAEGKTNKEIAAALFLSPKTIEYHLANTYRKLDIHSRAELARIVS
jgi:DNA-binding CsgD family transcriptional regulator